jgi:dimethylhistidine N-methyltransferase
MARPRNVTVVDHAPPPDSFREAMLAGLARRRKSIPSKFIYDARGSKLFEAILAAPEYYIPRVETALLAAHAAEIAALAGAGVALIEFGSGSSLKVRTLLDALPAPAACVAVDISRAPLIAAAEALARDYPGLEAFAVCADFTKPFPLPRPRARVGRRLGFFPGSTFGNLAPAEASAFLARARRMLAPDGAFVVGVDLRKDAEILAAAYNDRGGASAAFNTNVLARANRELGADFDLSRFRHQAVYDRKRGRMHIGIESLGRQTVRVAGRAFAFAAGEVIRTQLSRKFTVAGFQAKARRAGFEPLRAWTDAERLFSVHYLKAP